MLSKEQVSRVFWPPPAQDQNLAQIDPTFSEKILTRRMPVSSAEPEVQPVEDVEDEMVQAEAKEVVATTKARIPSASLCKLFSMMDATDALVLLVGILGAVGNGISQPLLCIVFGDIID